MKKEYYTNTAIIMLFVIFMVGLLIRGISLQDHHISAVKMGFAVDVIPWYIYFFPGYFFIKGMYSRPHDED